MGKHGIPTVGARGAGEVNLTPGLKRRLHKRARAQSRREHQAKIRALRAGRRPINRAYRQEAASVRGANALLQKQINAMLKGARASGLKGGYLRQLIAELRASKLDATRSVPFQLGDAAEQRRSDLVDLAQQIANERASQAADTASNFNSELDKARTHARSYIESKASDAKSAAGDKADRQRAISNALKTARVGYDELKAKGKEPTTPKEWRAFAQVVASQTEGADGTDAALAVKLLIRRIKKHTKISNFGPPAYPFR